MQDITPLLRTETLKELLIELFFLSDKPRTLSDLARAIDVDQTTVMREVNRLLETGVVAEERVGRSRTIAIDPTSPIAAPLKRLVRLAYEPPEGADGGRADGFAPMHAERSERRPLPSSRRRT
ncbi:MAG: winged helix-turn-helix transcriptional regulator [bacterium]|nr:winged helix-turn-helix transcriptional regulator [bacterium]